MFRKVLTCCCCVYLYVVLVFLKSAGLGRNYSIIYQWNQQQKNDDVLVVGQRKLTEITEVPKSTDKLEYAANEDLIQTCRSVNLLDYQCSKSCYNVSSTGTIDGHNTLPTKCALDNLVKHCHALKSLHKYSDIPVTDEERAFPLAFTIKMHEHAEQAEQLFRTMYRPHNLYCFHVDKKSDSRTFDIIKNMGNCFDNVIVIKDREIIVSSSFAYVTAELKCMKAMQRSKVSWKYYINLAGSEFPLRTNLEMVRILKFFKGLNDIETYTHPLFHSWRYENSFEVVQTSLVQVGHKSPLKYDIKLSMGNPLGLFSRQFVEFILTDNIAHEIVTWFNDTFAPHESVWATLVTLPWVQGSYPITIRHMINSFVSRAMIVTGDAPRCHGRYLRGQCLFSCGDIRWLSSRPEFVASKFDYPRDKETLNCLEMWYRQKAYQSEDVGIDWNHYNKLPHLKHHRNVKRLYTSAKKVSQTKSEWIKKHTIS